MGSGCGSVGREVASISEVRGSNPAIGKIFIESLLSTVLKFEEDENKKKKTFREWPIFKQLNCSQACSNFSENWKRKFSTHRQQPRDSFYLNLAKRANLMPFSDYWTTKVGLIKNPHEKWSSLAQFVSSVLLIRWA